MDSNYMTPEAQRIAISEACGWKPTLYQAVGKIGDVPFWYREGKFCHSSDLPDYLNDLNAMHEAEKVLNDSKRLNAYYGYLWNICGRGEEYVRATAAHRAEAFLLTLKL